MTKTDNLTQSMKDLPPEERMEALQSVVEDTLAGLDDDLRRDFWLKLSGRAGQDKVSSMVHL